VLQTVVTLMSDDPQSSIPAFDRKRGHTVVMKLLGAQNELVRLPALKMLGFFLCRATAK
jgi:hypothetical protein